jgi:hypothetical protein
MDQFVHIKRVDLTRIEPPESVADMLEEQPQLLPVVLSDQRTGRPSSCLLALDVPDADAFSNTANLPRVAQSRQSSPSPSALAAKTTASPFSSER